VGNGVSNLLEVISRIETYDREDSIFAKKPWTEESSCVVLAELESGGVPLIAQELGLAYFLEVDIVARFKEDVQSGKVAGTWDVSAICQRIIYLAIYDA